ncbi:methyltransferase-like protein 13 isoform X2 [Phalaenopsis equestris]|uniref:methyltransferase-like protein 13 isoform X2 n=1 Tax=Phalaenopsis equestris TaxID=78828 RepID=UPI0009E350F8|nr:methyltransferase-like protein 13 isoform X2 [Phalaenopsis equestris]
MGAEGMEPAVFEHLMPFEFLCFSFPNPLPSPENPYSETLRVAVADAPSSPSKTSPPAIAAVLVPNRREDDWVFSTAAGHFQLLLFLSSPNLSISRLVLIGNLPSCSSSLPRPYSRSQSDGEGASLDCFQESLMPLLYALCPKAAFVNGMPSIPFLVYEDGVIRCNPVEKVVGHRAGEMLVEDVEIEVSPELRELRRRLRFKKMPNLIQTQVRLLPDSVDVEVFRPEMGSLVQPYLGPMVSALFLNGLAIDEGFRFRSGNVLCVGVGGGPLVTALRWRFGFRVLGVEADEEVLSVARRHFGLFEDEFLKVFVDDGIRLIEDYALERSESKLFHAIMVDLDEEDPMNGIGAPPAKFLRRNVLAGARMALHSKGILVVNVIPSDESLYAMMIKLLRKFFCELYELKVEDGENFVIIATASPIGSDLKNMKKQGGIFEKLKKLGCESFIAGIKKI